MENNFAKIKKLWIQGSTDQKDGKFPREIAVQMDKAIFGFEVELRRWSVKKAIAYSDFEVPLPLTEKNMEMVKVAEELIGKVATAVQNFMIKEILADEVC